MGIPVVVVLGIVFWILISLLKYWYVGRTKINYTHKLDDSVLEEIRKVPKGAFERIMKRKQERNERFVDEPENYPFKEAETETNKGQSNAGKEGKDSVDKKQRRPLTIFEEMDLIQEQKKDKRQSKKYSKDMFEDPVSKLYKELQEHRKKKGLGDVPE